MNILKDMPAAGLAVIVIIAVLFVLSLIVLFYVYTRYSALAAKAAKNSAEASPFIRYTADKYREAFKQFGEDVNTPAIISDSIASKLGALLLGERFLNNAVSLFVTLGLFGTFLGLSLSVSSLTKLLSFTSTEEWLSVLNSVGGGLLSALSGMGVAFYTSLVGVACSIILTILRAIFSPEKQRAMLETRLELLCDHTLAPTLVCENPKDDASLIKALIGTLEDTAKEVKQTLGNAGSNLEHSTQQTDKTIARLNETVAAFSKSVRGYSEVDYNLRGSVERMDLAIRDLTAAMREINRRMNGGDE